MSVVDGAFPDGPEFWRDVLRGAAAIAEFLYGDRGERRRVFYLCQRTNFPHFREGATICARRSSILGWVAEQESNYGHPRPKPRPKSEPGQSPILVRPEEDYVFENDDDAVDEDQIELPLDEPDDGEGT